MGGVKNFNIELYCMDNDAMNVKGKTSETCSNVLGMVREILRT